MSEVYSQGESGYFESVAKRRENLPIIQDIHLEATQHEAITLTTPTGCSSRFRAHLLPAVPGRRVRAFQSSACGLVLVPRAGEKLSLHTGALLGADAKITSATVGAKMELICRKKGEWSQETGAVGTWIETIF